MHVQGLHSRLQPMLFFFVDGASLLDSSEPDWILLPATHKASDGSEHVVGTVSAISFERSKSDLYRMQGQGGVRFPAAIDERFVSLL